MRSPWIDEREEGNVPNMYPISNSTISNCRLANASPVGACILGNDEYPDR
jgi:hypothetical protein